MTTNQLITIIQQATAKGCRFVSITYRAKGTGELAKHTVLIGVKLENAYKKDVEKLSSLSLVGEAEKAREELLNSLKKSLQVGIGNNPAYTQKGKHETLTSGLRVDKEKGICQVYGFQMRKTVIQAGTYKKVNSSAKTIEKNKLRKALRSVKFRPFNVEAENLTTAKINGRTLELA